MTDRTIDLDQHRGPIAQKETDLRRLRNEVAENEARLRHQRQQLEAHMVATPASNWLEAAEKARYVLGEFAGSMCAKDPRTQALISAVLADFDRLSR